MRVVGARQDALGLVLEGLSGVGPEHGGDVLAGQVGGFAGAPARPVLDREGVGVRLLAPAEALVVGDDGTGVLVAGAARPHLDLRTALGVAYNAQLGNCTVRMSWFTGSAVTGSTWSRADS